MNAVYKFWSDATKVLQLLVKDLCDCGGGYDDRLEAEDHNEECMYRKFLEK